MPLCLDYTVLDVFAERALEGNPLAVFHDARGLSTKQMQALTRELNLSESTFVLPSGDLATDREEGVRVRIFTPREELPFAGHPTLGTAAWLRLRHPAFAQADAVTLQLGVGPVMVRFAAPAAPTPDGHGVYGTMRQPDPQFLAELEPAQVARAIGLAPEDLLPGLTPQIVSTGNAFCIVPLRSHDVLRELAIPQATAMPWLRERGGRWFYCIAAGERGEARPGAVWHARMQWQDGEDPATGSAAGPCIAWLVRTGLARSGQPVVVRQGDEIGRPSRLFVQAKRIGAEIREVEVGGRTIPVASGRFLLQG